MNYSVNTETDTATCIGALQYLGRDPIDYDWCYMISIVDSTPTKYLLGHRAVGQFIDQLHTVYGGRHIGFESSLNVLPITQHDDDGRLVVNIFVGGVEIDMTAQEFCHAAYAIWLHSMSNAKLCSDLLSGAAESEYLNYMNDGSCPFELTAKLFESIEIKFEVIGVGSDDVASLIGEFEAEDSCLMFEKINMIH